MNINFEIIENLKKITESVGRFQLEHFRIDAQGAETEKKVGEFVTQIDIESEKRIEEFLKNIYPQVGFFGEESGKKNLSDWVWVVDPIDGTNNFISGIDQFSISIALQHKEKAVAGIIYKPFSHEAFYAIKDQGAFYNGKPLTKHKPYDFSKAVIGTGFPFRAMHTYDSFSKTMKDCLTHARGIRRLGSAALDLAYVAAGFMQGFWEVALEPYDVAAGLLLLEETGITYSNFNGDPYDSYKHQTLVAGMPNVYENLLTLVKQNYDLKV